MDFSSPATKKEEPSGNILAKLYGTVAVIFSIAWLIAFHFGAAYLSHAKYNSFGWALLDFFFAGFYYPYYAIFLNTPSSGFLGGRRK